MGEQRERIAQLEFSPEQDHLEIVVPKGFKYQDIPRLSEKLLSRELLEKLRHACGECLSGKPIFIKERFEREVTVDLDSMEIDGIR
jgi:hypothetical protein